MKKIHLLLTLCILFISIPTYAFVKETVYIDNVYYGLKEDGTALVDANWDLLNPISYKGILNIPSTIEYKNESYKVTGFGKMPYTSADKPTDIRYVTSLSVGKYFCGLSSEQLKNSQDLTSINIDENNAYYSSIDGVLYNKNQTELIFCPLGKKGEYYISDKTNSINKYAFYQSKLQMIYVPQTVTSINKDAFTKAKTSITLYGKYSDYTFLSTLDSSSVVCASRTEYKSIKSVFSGNVNTLEKYYVSKQTKTLLTSVTFTIPKYLWTYRQSTNPKDPLNGVIHNGYSIRKVTVGDKEINPNKDGSYTATDLLPNKTYRVHFYWVRYYKKDVIAESGENEDSIKTAILKVSLEYLKSNSGSITLKAFASKDESLSPSEYGCFCVETNKYYETKNDNVDVEDLTPNTDYTFYPYAIYMGEYYVDKTSSLKIQTDLPEFKKSVYISQTTLSFKSFSVVAENTTEQPTQLEIHIEGNNYVFNGETIHIKGLIPNRKYNVEFIAKYKNGTCVSKWVEYETSGTNPWFKVMKITPTTMFVKATFIIDKATLSKAYFSYPEEYNYSQQVVEGNNGYTVVYFTLKHLRPSEEYRNLTFVVETKEGSKESYTQKGIIKTGNLKLDIQPAKVIGNGSALVCAETNIDTEETNVGFEWRKTDAPDVVVSKFGIGTIYANTLEGRISNLSSSSYYKVRAYYQSRDGKKYYSDWIGFDPSDFSFFEPTVHTYTKISIENNTAQVRGVALQGSDDILEQGFEYWMENEAKSRSTNAVQKVLATGQNMEAELTNLAYNTTYYCRAYVKTEKTTTYGETQQFTTLKQTTSGISNITSEAHEDFNFAVRQDDGLKISISGNNEIYSYRITNINGSQVAQGKVLANNDWHHITKQRLPNGIYIIVVTNNKQMKIKKVAIK